MKHLKTGSKHLKKISGYLKGSVKYIDGLVRITAYLTRLKSIFIIIILTRLLFLEHNQLALIAEILSAIIVLTPTAPLEGDYE